MVPNIKDHQMRKTRHAQTKLVSSATNRYKVVGLEWIQEPVMRQ